MTEPFYVQVKQDARFKIITAFGGIEVTKQFPVAIEDDPEGKNREEAERHEYLEVVAKPSSRSSDGGNAKPAAAKKSSARSSGKKKTGAKGEESLAATSEEDDNIFDLTK